MTSSTTSRSRRRATRAAIAILTAGAALLGGGQALAPAPALATMNMEDGENTCTMAPDPEEVSCPAGGNGGGESTPGGGEAVPGGEDPGEVIVLPPVIVDPPSACPHPYTSCLPSAPGGPAKPSSGRDGDWDPRTVGHPGPGSPTHRLRKISSCEMIYRLARHIRLERDDDDSLSGVIRRGWEGSQLSQLERLKTRSWEEGCPTVLGEPFPHP